MTVAGRPLDERGVLTVLGRHVGPARAQTMLAHARRTAVDAGPSAAGNPLLARLGDSLRSAIGEAQTRAVIAELTRLLAPARPEPVELDLKVESDIARARSAARDLGQALGVSPLVLQKLATIVSELARNIISYAGSGRLALRPGEGGRRCVHIEARDQGPGIPNLAEILAGRYKSRSGLGLGILGTKRLADKFAIESNSGGTRVEVEVGF